MSGGIFDSIQFFASVLVSVLDINKLFLIIDTSGKISKRDKTITTLDLFENLLDTANINIPAATARKGYMINWCLGSVYEGVITIEIIENRIGNDNKTIFLWRV